MGTLMGHVLPGSFFIAASLWWLWVMLHRYFKARLPAKGAAGAGGRYEFRASMSVACPCTGSRFPLFGVLIISLVAVGIVGEVYTGFRGGKFVVQGNGQHITMYFFFGLVALCEVVRFYGMPLPRDVDYAMFLLAVLIEAMLFFHHLHGRSMLDIQIHMYLVYVLLALFACAAVEMKHRTSFLAAAGRVLLTLVQGVWFITVGWILYPPPGSPVWGRAADEHGMHDEIMMATTVFAVHIAGAILFAFGMGVVVSARVRSLGHYAPTYELKMAAGVGDIYSPLNSDMDDNEDDDAGSNNVLGSAAAVDRRRKMGTDDENLA